MSTTIILLIIVVIILKLFGFLVWFISKGVGFSMVWTYFKAYIKKKKGFGVAVFYSNTGVPLYRIVDLNKDHFKIELFDDKESRYNVKTDCIHFNANAIPVIMYPANDADPFNPVKGMPTVTDPQVQQATIAKINLAESTYSGEFEWLKKNWFKLAIFFCVVVGIFGFVIMHQNDSLVELSKQIGQSAVIGLQNVNVTTLGK